jgi:hypothetical protein
MSVRGTSFVADDDQVLHFGVVQGLDQVLRDAAQPKSSHQQFGAVLRASEVA